MSSLRTAIVGCGKVASTHAAALMALPSSELVAACDRTVVVLVGNVVPSVTLPVQDVVSRELKLIGTAASATEFPRAIELIATGTVDVGSLISEVVPLAAGVRAFARLRQPGTDLLKVVLEP